MKMKRLNIFSIILICMMLVSCSQKNVESEKNIYKSNSENELENESENEIEPHVIKASVITKYNDKEIIVTSDTTCFFYLSVSIRDGETISNNSYGEFKISKGEIITLTIKDLAKNFYSDDAIITYVGYVDNPYIYEESVLEKNNYNRVDCPLLMKFSTKEIIVYSDKNCLFDLEISTEDANFKSSNSYTKLHISEGETLTLTLEDLAPGFFSDTTIIQYCNPHIKTYE